MDYVKSFGSYIRDAYNNLNPATLSGAIDIIVAQHPNGELTTSPFHVRFGKLGVLSPKEKIINISINGEVVDDIHMKLGDQGEAFFVTERGVNEVLPTAYITSPIRSPMELTPVPSRPESPRPNVVENNNVYGSEGDMLDMEFDETEFIEEGPPDHPPFYTPRDSIFSQGMENYQPTINERGDSEESDRFANPDNLLQRLESLKMDSPRRIRRRHSMSSDSPVDNNTPTMVWPFGELPQEVPKEDRLNQNRRPPSLVLSSVPKRIPRRRRFDSEPPLALTKMRTSELPEVFSPTSPLSPFSETIDSGTDCDDFESEFSLSLCGGLLENNEISCPDSFKKNQVTFEQFSREPKKFITHPSLVVRMGTKYYNWTACSAIILSMMVYQRPLSEDTVNGLQQESLRKRSWFAGYWPRSVSTSEAYSRNPAPISMPSKPKLPASSESLEVPPAAANGLELSRSFSVPSPDFCPIFHDGDRIMKKTLVLSSDELKKLNLKYGENTIDFWLTTMLQGTTKISASIYLWNTTDSIVISDIDGTITKSDVMGNIFPAIGKDWSQKGVTHLYQRIHNNGYKILYLSSRAIGQAYMTKNYLKSVIQDGVSLPSGPVMLNPTSLFNAFHKEVIVRRPEEFKISCLHGIRQVFADKDETVNPFWAGFGNRPTDVKSYRNVGITDRRIYIVNPLGHLKEQQSSISGYSTCYKDLGDNCDHFFPDKNQPEVPDQTVSSYKYWKTDLPEVDFSLLS